MSGAAAMMLGGGAGNIPVLVGMSPIASNVGGGSDVAVAKPTGVAVGDFLLAIMANERDTTWTGDTGWEEVADLAAASGLRVARKVAGASEPASYTFSMTGGVANRIGVILAYRGAQFDVAGAFGTASGASACVAPALSMSDDGILLAAFACDDGRTFTTPTDMLEMASGKLTSGPSIAVFSEQVSSGSTGTRTSTPNNATSSAGILIGLKGA